jgi:hypothetical protein
MRIEPDKTSIAAIQAGSPCKDMAAVEPDAVVAEDADRRI